MKYIDWLIGRVREKWAWGKAEIILKIEIIHNERNQYLLKKKQQATLLYINGQNMALQPFSLIFLDYDSI